MITNKIVTDRKGELYQLIKNTQSNNYRKMHNLPMLRGDCKKILHRYDIKVINVSM